MESGTSMHPSIRILADELEPLDHPLLLAAFGGAQGDTAAAALTYLASEWEADPVAAIDPDPFLNFAVTRPIVRIEDGERVIDWPETLLYVARPEGVDRDIVLLVGPEPHHHWQQYAGAVQDILRALAVEEAVLVSSFAGATPHTRPTPVHLVGADEALAGLFPVPARQPRYQGPASYAMALVVMLREAGLRVGTLSSIAPFYLGVDPNPYAVRALVQTIDRGLGSVTLTTEIDARIDEVEEHAAAAMRKSDDLRTFVLNLEEQYDESTDAAPVAANPLDGLAVDELIGDVESFLRSHSDMPGTSADGDAHPR